MDRDPQEGESMTPADRDRIAREWGVPAEQIPQPTVCPPAQFSPWQKYTRDQLWRANKRIFHRRQRMEALAIREGRT